MKVDLQQLANEWQGHSFYHEKRAVQVVDNPIVAGELLLILSVTLKVTVENQSKDVVCGSRLFTQENASQQEKSSRDCYMFNQESSRLDIKFGDRYEQTLTDLINEVYGDGFV